MENKKDIGKAFREKLDGIDRQPGDALWNAISTDLDAKKKKKRLPLWMWVGAITAIITVTAWLSHPLWEGYVPEIYMKMPNSSGTNSGSSESNTATGSSIENDSESEIVKSEKGENNAKNADVTTTNNQNKINEEDAGKNTNSNGKKSGTTNQATTIKTTGTTATGVTATGSNRKKRNSGQAGSTNVHPTTYYNQNSTAGTTFKAGTNQKNSGKQKSISTNNTATGNNNINEKTKTIGSLETTTMADGIAGVIKGRSKEETETKTDSLTLPITKDSLAVAEKKKQEDTKKTDSIATPAYKQFYAYVWVGPGKFSFPSGNSLIGTSLDNNKTSTEITFNYGGYLGYELTKKWGVRLGVMSNGIKHTTENVMLNNGSMWALNYKGIDFNDNAVASIPADSTSYNLVQKTRLLEFPLEVTYKINDSKKLNFGAVGGISIIYAAKNEIYAESAQRSILLGSLNKIKDVSVGGSLGFGLYYKILPELQLNAEPILRYYFSTFEDMQPFAISLQAGLQYNFNIPKKKNK